ncbi:condensation domain-containing protein [Actinosynnema sp. NPDC059335]|uniref:condensation domain-containing protein n=1 Tax=Actinosynnema sp. NPDC059335 TaxID=3346804 RepID=UPI00366F663F
MTQEEIRTATTIAPLSPAQHGIWFTEQFAGPTSLYHISFAHRLRGPLDAEALDAALTALVRRHEPLRTRVDLSTGEPRQSVLSPGPASAKRVDLSTHPEAEAAAARENEDHVLRPFRLDAEDPFRVLLLRMAEDHHILTVVIHHICADGLSLPVFSADLAAFYRGEELPPLPVGYTAHVRRALARPPDAEALARWRERLRGAPPLALPTDRPRPRIRSPHGARVALTVDADLVRRARDHARRHGATLFMVLLANFFAVLARRSGVGDLSVGVPLSGREGPDEEAMIGLFTNTVVLRVDLSDRPSFDGLLRRVRSTAFDAYDDGHVPFQQVVEAVSPPRDLSRTPLFQVVFTVQDFAEDDLRLPGVTATPVPLPSRTSEFELELELAWDGEGLVGFVAYSTDLFDRATAAALAEDYLTSLHEHLGVLR